MAYTVTIDPYHIEIQEGPGPHSSFTASRTAAVEVLEKILAAVKADILTIKRAPTFEDYLDRVAASPKAVAKDRHE